MSIEPPKVLGNFDEFEFLVKYKKDVQKFTAVVVVVNPYASIHNKKYPIFFINLYYFFANTLASTGFVQRLSGSSCVRLFLQLKYEMYRECD